MGRDRSHAGEMMFFLRFIPEDKLQHPMRRLRVMAAPVASERIGRQSIVITRINKLTENFKLHPVVSYDPMGPAMNKRGTITRSTFRHLVNVLTASNGNGSPSRVGPHEDDDADKVRATAPSKCPTIIASPSTTQEPSDGDPASLPCRATSSGR